MHASAKTKIKSIVINRKKQDESVLFNMNKTNLNIE